MNESEIAEELVAKDLVSAEREAKFPPKGAAWKRNAK